MQIYSPCHEEIWDGAIKPRSFSVRASWRWVQRRALIGLTPRKGSPFPIDYENVYLPQPVGILWKIQKILPLSEIESRASVIHLLGYPRYLLSYTGSREFRNYRGKLDAYADVGTKQVKLFTFVLGRFKSCVKPLIFFSLEVDFATECVWFWWS